MKKISNDHNGFISCSVLTIRIDIDRIYFQDP